MGYIFQTYGLSHTTAAITGFVTGLYVVFTPLIAAALLKKRIPAKAWGAVFLATIGLAFLSLEGFAISFGAVLVLVSAIFFAAHIVSLGEWSAGRDVYAMTIVQLAMCGILTTIGAIPDGIMLPPNSKVWWVVIFTAICGTAIAFIIQTWAQSVMSPTTVAVLLTTETVWAAFFAVAVGGENLTLRIIVGGILVLFAMYQIIILDSRESA
jgi:drug/metabolite transporter (DMT)-like permease